MAGDQVEDRRDVGDRLDRDAFGARRGAYLDGGNQVADGKQGLLAPFGSGAVGDGAAEPGEMVPDERFDSEVRRRRRRRQPVELRGRLVSLAFEIEEAIAEARGGNAGFDGGDQTVDPDIGRLGLLLQLPAPRGGLALGPGEHPAPVAFGGPHPCEELLHGVAFQLLAPDAPVVRAALGVEAAGLAAIVAEPGNHQMPAADAAAEPGRQRIGGLAAARHHGEVALLAPLQLVLDGVPGFVVHDPHVGGFGNDPFLRRNGNESAAPGDGVAPAALAAVHQHAAVEVEAEYPVAAAPAYDLGAPRLVVGPDDAFPVENAGDLLRAHAVEVEPVDAADHAGLLEVDDALAPDGLAAFGDVVGHAVAVYAVPHDPEVVEGLDLPPARLGADIVDDHLGYGPLDVRMEGVDLAVLQAVQVDPQEPEFAVKPRHVGGAPGEPVQALYADAVETARAGVLKQLAEPRAQLHGCAGKLRVGVFVRDHAAQIGDAVAAEAELARDRGHLLHRRGIARIDGEARDVGGMSVHALSFGYRKTGRFGERRPPLQPGKLPIPVDNRRNAVIAARAAIRPPGPRPRCRTSARRGIRRYRSAGSSSRPEHGRCARKR